jgi:hypothetical protein
MADTSPAPTEKTVVATPVYPGRLRTLVTISLTLNVLILLLLVAGAIIHHHHKPHGFAGRDGHGGWGGEGQCPMDDGPRFHRFGGMDRGWGGPDGFRGGPGAMGGPNRPGMDGPPDRGPGDVPPAPGMPGMGGMRGMMGGFMGKPDPARMTDMLLNHLSSTLSLTDDQKAKIKPIIEQQVADLEKQMEAQRAAMQKQIEDAKAKIKPLLNADQQKQLDAMPLPGQKPPPPDSAEQPVPPPGQ